MVVWLPVVPMKRIRKVLGLSLTNAGEVCWVRGNVLERGTSGKKGPGDGVLNLLLR